MVFSNDRCFDILVICKNCRQLKFFNNALTYLMMDCFYSCSGCMNTVYGPAKNLFWGYTGLINRALGHIHDLKGVTFKKMMFMELMGNPPGPLEVEQIDRNYTAALLKKEIIPVGFDIAGIHLACHACKKDIVLNRDDFRELAGKAPVVCPECRAPLRRSRSMLKEFFHFIDIYRASVKEMELSGFAVVPISKGNAAFDGERERILSTLQFG